MSDPKWQFHVLICRLLVQLSRAFDVLDALRVFPLASAEVCLSDPILFIEIKVRKNLQFFGRVRHLPQRNPGNCRHPNIRESFFRVVACRREANMELDHVEQIMLVDLVAGTASFFINLCFSYNKQHCG